LKATPHSIIDELQDPAVRDLAWVIGSPGLLDGTYPAYQGHVVEDKWCQDQLHVCATWLSKLDAHPQTLHDFIQSRPTRRLGHYFETLITFWLTHLKETELIATNLQVQDAQRTLGEYDFLFRHSEGETFHWEAAVKFYLQVTPQAEQSSFIGPGTRDRLDIKLNKVFKQQLLLSNSPEGRQALPKNIKPDRTQAFIKGYLFYHFSIRHKLSIAGVSARHLSGWWMRHNLEKIPQTNTDSLWAILPRLNWLAPALITDKSQVNTYSILAEQLDQHFQAGSEALLVAELTGETGDVWRELSRGFVVCSTWPIIKASDAN
jgi:hypothetical protein